MDFAQLRMACYAAGMAKPTEKPNPKISVFLSTEDHKAAKRAADEAEISLSKWIEALVKKALRTKKVAA